MIRRAIEKDIENINNLLYQVHKVHSDNRPDIFKVGLKKYTTEELILLIKDDKKPIFVYADDNNNVLGYVFCIYEEIKGITSLVDRKILFIDDFCVDYNYRGQNIGEKLYNFVENEAKSNNCNSITLNVWNFNEEALRFYNKLGFCELKTVMEKKF